MAGETKITEWSHFFMLPSKYFILPSTFLEYGVELNVFRNLEDKPEIVPPGYIDDFTGTVLALQLTNKSSYLGYALTMNAGFLWDSAPSSSKPTPIHCSLYPHLRRVATLRGGP